MMTLAPLTDSPGQALKAVKVIQAQGSFGALRVHLVNLEADETDLFEVYDVPTIGDLADWVLAGELPGPQDTSFQMVTIEELLKGEEVQLKLEGAYREIFIFVKFFAA